MIKSKSEKRFRELLDVRRQIIPILQKIPITPYSHDSVNHALETVNFLYKLFQEALTEFTADELFVLGVFCLIHDIGMRSRGELSPKQLYDSHNADSSKYAQSLKIDSQEITFSQEIAALCLVHNKCLDEAKVYLEPLENHQLRLVSIFCMFRVADMLDVEIQPGEEILRINQEFLERSIAQIDINATHKKVLVERNFGVDEEQFQNWLSYFTRRLNEYNQVLNQVEHEYTVEVMN